MANVKNEVLENDVQLTIIEKLLDNGCKLRELRGLTVGYVEPNEHQNINEHGFRPMIVNKNLAQSINKGGLIYPLLVADKDYTGKAFLFDFDKVSELKDGDFVTDGEMLDNDSFDVILRGGKQRLASLARYGNKTVKLRFEVQSENAVNMSNLQKSQTNSVIMSKIIGLKNSLGSDFDLKKTIIATGADWTTATMNNNKTSINVLLNLLDAVKGNDFHTVLISYVFDDTFSFTHLRKFVDFLGKDGKTYFELNKYMLDENGKTVKENGKNVVNDNFYNALSEAVKKYFDYCDKEISVSKTKVSEFLRLIKLAKNGQTETTEKGTDDNKKQYYKCEKLHKDTCEQYDSLENAALNIHKYCATLEINAENDKIVLPAYNTIKQRFNLAAPEFNTLLKKCDKWLKEKDVLAVKALANKMFKYTTTKDGETVTLTPRFHSVLKDLKADEKALIIDAIK